MNTQSIERICILAVIIFWSSKVSGNNSNILHCSYKHLYGLTWQVTVNLYWNCDYYGTAPITSSYAFHNLCNNQIKTVRYAHRADTLPNGLPYLSNSYNDYCTGSLSMCDSPFNASGLIAWRHIVYYDTVTLPEPCSLWKFSRGAISASNYRDPMVTNITSHTYTYYNEALLNADSTNPNTSADWVRPMFMYACENQPTQWYLPVTDVDGDSLVYSMVAPRERDNIFPNPLDTLVQDIPFISPYSLTTEPFGTNESWEFDPTIPAVRFNALPNQLALLTFKVEEYRQGVFMGATFRDVLIHVIPCNHPVPLRTIDTAQSFHVQLSGVDTVEVYAGQSVVLKSVYHSAASSAQLFHESNIPTVLQNVNYATSYLGTGGDSLLTTLQWTPTLSDTGVYLLVTTVKDTSCVVSEPRIPQDYFHRLIVHGFPQGVNNSHQASGINLYPNPANNSIHVEMKNEGDYVILNSQSMIMAKGKTNKQGVAELDVSKLSKGIYFFKSGMKVISFTVIR